MSYKQRPLTLRSLPLTYDRELGDLVFLYNYNSGYTDTNIGLYFTFVIRGRSRFKNPTLVLKPAYCKTETFQASFFSRIVKPWNIICNLAPRDKFWSLSMLCFKIFCAPFILLLMLLLTILTCLATSSSLVIALATALNFYLTDYNCTLLGTISN